MGKVRVAIIGVGNCASSLVQGVHYYRNAPETETVSGLTHFRLGGYHVGGPPAHFITSPPVQHSDEQARQMVEEFIVGPVADSVTQRVRE